MEIVIAGGTGFIGRSLVGKLLQDGHNVVVLTRDGAGARQLVPDAVGFGLWDGKTSASCVQQINGADAVINLAGESLAGKRWSPKQKARIINSRLEATRAIVKAMEQAERCPSLLINASAVGYYGNVEHEQVTETHPQGGGFLALTCGLWEHEAIMARQLGVRVVLLRLGVVLDKAGGALARMVPAFRLFFGGRLGSGRQWFPWVHRDDVAGVVRFVLDNPDLCGPINVAAPEAVTMDEFCRSLGKALARPVWARVPGFVLRLALGEMSEMLLTGQRVVPQKLLQAGYEFLYPNLAQALDEIFKRHS